MKKKILIGSIITVSVLILLSLNTVVSVHTIESSENKMILEESTPIALVLQLLAKLRTHKDIESIESEDDILQIIEDEDELNIIFGRIKDSDCDCYDDSKLDLVFPFFCLFLTPFLLIAGLFLMSGMHYNYVNIVFSIARLFNCIS